MLILPPSVRIFLCASAVDMRRSFDSLAALVQEAIGQDVYTGHLFIFRSRRGDRLKILWWDRTGLCLWYKRLEAGTFRFPSSTEGCGVEIESADLAMLLEGIDLSGARRRRRFRLAATEATAA